MAAVDRLEASNQALQAAVVAALAKAGQPSVDEARVNAVSDQLDSATAALVAYVNPPAAPSEPAQ